MRWCSNKCVPLHGQRRHGGRSGKGRRKEGRIKGGRRERVTNVGAGGEGVMKSRASYVGTSAQPCSTCEVTTPWMSTISCFTPPPAAWREDFAAKREHWTLERTETRTQSTFADLDMYWTSLKKKSNVSTNWKVATFSRIPRPDSLTRIVTAKRP